MAKRRAISFESSAPDDWEFDESDNLIAPGNKWNTEFVVQALRAKGYQVDAPSNHEDFGWEFGCSLEGNRFWLLVAMGSNENENYIWVDSLGLLKRLLGGDEARDSLLRLLQSSLGSDSHFSNVHEARL